MKVVYFAWACMFPKHEILYLLDNVEFKVNAGHIWECLGGISDFIINSLECLFFLPGEDDVNSAAVLPQEEISPLNCHVFGKRTKHIHGIETSILIKNFINYGSKTLFDNNPKFFLAELI